MKLIYNVLILLLAVDNNVAANINPGGNLVIPYLYWMGMSIVPVVLGAALVTYVEPITAGSGMPQVKSYLNGIKIPRIVRIKTLAVKAVGVVTAVVGGLVGGKVNIMIYIEYINYYQYGFITNRKGQWLTPVP